MGGFAAYQGDRENARIPPAGEVSWAVRERQEQACGWLERDSDRWDGIRCISGEKSSCKPVNLLRLGSKTETELNETNLTALLCWCWRKELIMQPDQLFDLNAWEQVRKELWDERTVKNKEAIKHAPVWRTVTFMVEQLKGKAQITTTAKPAIKEPKKDLNGKEQEKVAEAEKTDLLSPKTPACPTTRVERKFWAGPEINIAPWDPAEPPPPPLPPEPPPKTPSSSSPALSCLGAGPPRCRGPQPRPPRARFPRPPPPPPETGSVETRTSPAAPPTPRGRFPSLLTRRPTLRDNGSCGRCRALGWGGHGGGGEVSCVISAGKSRAGRVGPAAPRRSEGAQRSRGRREAPGALGAGSQQCRGGAGRKRILAGLELGGKKEGEPEPFPLLLPPRAASPARRLPGSLSLAAAFMLQRRQTCPGGGGLPPRRHRQTPRKLKVLPQHKRAGVPGLLSRRRCAETARGGGDVENYIQFAAGSAERCRPSLAAGKHRRPVRRSERCLGVPATIKKWKMTCWPKKTGNIAQSREFLAGQGI